MPDSVNQPPGHRSPSRTTFVSTLHAPNRRIPLQEKLEKSALGLSTPDPLEEPARHIDVLDGHPLEPAPVLGASLVPGDVDQDPPHRLGRGSEEMPAPLPSGLIGADPGWG
jgi:hypothetical protein